MRDGVQLLGNLPAKQGRVSTVDVHRLWQRVMFPQFAIGYAIGYQENIGKTSAKHCEKCVKSREKQELPVDFLAARTGVPKAGTNTSMAIVAQHRCVAYALAAAW